MLIYFQVIISTGLCQQFLDVLQSVDSMEPERVKSWLPPIFVNVIVCFSWNLTSAFAYDIWERKLKSSHCDYLNTSRISLSKWETLCRCNDVIYAYNDRRMSFFILKTVCFKKKTVYQPFYWLWILVWKNPFL